LAVEVFYKQNVMILWSKGFATTLPAPSVRRHVRRLRLAFILKQESLQSLQKLGSSKFGLVHLRQVDIGIYSLSRSRTTDDEHSIILQAISSMSVINIGTQKLHLTCHHVKPINAPDDAEVALLDKLSIVGEMKGVKERYERIVFRQRVNGTGQQETWLDRVEQWPTQESSRSRRKTIKTVWV
jgi:hypothetical protein